MPNFEFLASPVPEIRGGSHNSKIGSRNPLVTPIDLIFHFFPLAPLGVHPHAKFRVSSFYRSRIRVGSHNSKIGSRDSLTTPIDLILHFLLKPRVVNLSVKIDTNMFTGDRYMAILSLR